MHKIAKNKHPNNTPNTPPTTQKNTPNNTPTTHQKHPQNTPNHVSVFGLFAFCLALCCVVSIFFAFFLRFFIFINI